MKRERGVAPGVGRFGMRLSRLATLISRFEILLAVAVSTFVGVLAALFVEDLPRAGVSTLVTILVVLAIVALLIFAQWFAWRKSTDFGICVVAWESATPFDGHVSLSEGIGMASRSWCPLEMDLPADAPAPPSWLMHLTSEMDRICHAATRTPIGDPRLAIAPATRDHCAFFLGQSLRASLVDVAVGVWGRTAVSEDRSKATWGHRFDIEPSSHKRVFTRMDASPAVVPPQLDETCRGIMVISPRRVPAPYWSDGAPDIGKYVLEHGAGYALVKLSEDLDSLPGEPEMIRAAMKVQACARSVSGGSHVPLRLVCGEAEAFALGLLVGPLCPFQVEVWAGAGWKRWSLIGG